MKRLVSGSSMVLGLALIASSLVGCASYSNGQRTSSVATAAYIAASVAICTLGDDPVTVEENSDLVDAPETVPEHLLGEDLRYDPYTGDALPAHQLSHETAPGAVFDPETGPPGK